MKKLFYILFAASALLFVSCAKEVDDNITAPEAKLTGETITFSATIDMPAATRAALSGLNINWQSGDYIAFATDNDATIRVYPVTVDGENPTKCTITVDKVDGASGYYAIFKGSLGDGGAGVNSVDADDYSMVTFNTTTKTFSGLTVGNQQVAKNSLSSYLWYSDGYPLAMAGKADGSSLSMKPCLALVRLGINAESVPAGYYYSTIVYNNPTYGIDHPHDYTAVRGFNLYQKGVSTIYSSGDYDVQIADNGSLTTTAAGNNSEYRQLAGTEKMSVDTDYLMCVIPGGTVSSFKIGFLGWSANSSSSYSYSAAYTMTKGGVGSVNPGDYYDLGVLNPLGRKKAANEAADDAADDAAQSYVPAITIDGDLSDWAGITVLPSNTTGRIREWKFKSDAFMVYFYLKLRGEKVATTKNLYVGIDTDNDSNTQISAYAGDMTGCEAVAKIVPASLDDPLTLVNGLDPNSRVYHSNGSSTSGTVKCMGYIDSGEVYIELSIPRDELGIPVAGNTVTVGCSYEWNLTGSQSLVLE